MVLKKIGRGGCPKNNPKNLDPSYQMDLDIWDCFGREGLVADLHHTDLNTVELQWLEY